MADAPFTLADITVNQFGDFDELLAATLATYRQQKQCFAISLNPEMLVASTSSEQIKNLLRRADLTFADGIGVVLAVKRKYGAHIKRLPGCEFWEKLMQAAKTESLPVFLVGSRPEVLDDTVNKLNQSYQPKIVGAVDGYFDNEQDVIDQIKTSGAKIVTVAMGSPRQEQFIVRCMEQNIQAIFLGVGGTYDVFSGHVKRAPAFWRKMGLEWFYRLASEPRRITRQMGLAYFLWQVVLKKF